MTNNSLQYKFIYHMYLHVFIIHFKILVCLFWVSRAAVVDLVESKRYLNNHDS